MQSQYNQLVVKSLNATKKKEKKKREYLHVNC